MTLLTTIEIRKILSTRSGAALVAASAVLPAGLLAIMMAVDEGPPNAPTMLAFLSALVTMLLLAIGVLSSAGEWTHGTVQTTFLTVPRRGKVLAAKYLGTAALGAGLAAVVVATTYAVAAVLGRPGFGWSGAGWSAAAAIAAGTVLTVAGTGIGAAIGNTPAALTGTYLVLLVGMSVLNGFKPVWGKHVDPLSAVFDLVERDAIVRPVSVLAGWLVAAAVTGVVLTRRRQVT